MPLHPCTDACRHEELDATIVRLLSDHQAQQAEIDALRTQVERLEIELRDTLAPDYEVENLYRYLWDNESYPGYVVYRHFDDLTCTALEMARHHKVAAFVCESEATDYCAYRNEIQAKYGTDSVHAIKRPAPTLGKDK